jgi:hypothetical protein
MEKEYVENPLEFNLYGMDEYLDLLVRMVEKLNPSFVVERIAGEVPPWFLAGPGWGLIRITEITHAFEKKLMALDTWQGRLYKK